MAFSLKTNKNVRVGQEFIPGITRVSRPAASLPQTSTHQLFQVRGGRVKIHDLVGEVTTVFQAVDPILKVSSKKLDAAMTTAVGTAVDVASTAVLTSSEVGALLYVEGDGTAIVKSNAGAAFIGSQGGTWIAANGEIYITTGASVTGAAKWDVWYTPLDEGARVVSIDAATAAI